MYTIISYNNQYFYVIPKKSSHTRIWLCQLIVWSTTVWQRVFFREIDSFNVHQTWTDMLWNPGESQVRKCACVKVFVLLLYIYNNKSVFPNLLSIIWKTKQSTIRLKLRFSQILCKRIIIIERVSVYPSTNYLVIKYRNKS